MVAWRNTQQGGTGRTDDSRGPKPARAWQGSGPGGDEWNGRHPTSDGSRQGQDVRLRRHLRVTAS
jgi:hypothetical protein